MTVTTTPMTGTDYDLLKAQIAAFWSKQERSAEDKDWDESQHPRDEHGRFTDSGSGFVDDVYEGTHSKEQAASLRRVEDEIAPLGHPLDHEVAAAVDANGKVLFSKGGSESAVSFTDYELSLMRGAVLTHNHPGYKNSKQEQIYSGFSADDIVTAAHGGASEVRAINERHIYSMRPGAGESWPPEGPRNVVGQWDSGRDNRGTLRQELATAKAEVEGRFWPEIRAGRMTIGQAASEHPHEVAKLVASRLGLQYTRVNRR